MKLTAQRKGDPMTTRLSGAFVPARFYRNRMRLLALYWRIWRLSTVPEYADDYKVRAVHNRNLALLHERTQP